mmetsp:Transcript_12023/g.26033  ORF Transcript_12023/g.26033 Transcript_12023/m.26033 type:complete len:287 (-) Transcript_12023:378-1238(-)
MASAEDENPPKTSPPLCAAASQCCSEISPLSGSRLFGSPQVPMVSEDVPSNAVNPPKSSSFSTASTLQAATSNLFSAVSTTASWPSDDSPSPSNGLLVVSHASGTVSPFCMCSLSSAHTEPTASLFWTVPYAPPGPSLAWIPFTSFSAQTPSLLPPADFFGCVSAEGMSSKSPGIKLVGVSVASIFELVRLCADSDSFFSLSPPIFSVESPGTSTGTAAKDGSATSTGGDSALPATKAPKKSSSTGTASIFCAALVLASLNPQNGSTPAGFEWSVLPFDKSCEGAG